MIDLAAARAIAVQALAANADANDANEVLNYAIGQLGYQLKTLQRACLDGVDGDDLDVFLICLQERVEALEKFSVAFLEVAFKSLPGGAS